MKYLIIILIITLCSCTTTYTILESDFDKAKEMCECNGGIKSYYIHVVMGQSTYITGVCNNDVTFKYNITQNRLANEKEKN